MNKPYRILVFGKPDCAKCKALNKRLDKLLATDEWADFEKQYCDLETEDGLVRFSEAECINPQRIPALLITHWNETEGEYAPVPRAALDHPEASRLYQYLGLQTDYSEAGRGVLPPDKIVEELSAARAAA